MNIRGENYFVMAGSCLDRLAELTDESVDSVVTDPPYELGFMGKKWDNSGIAFDTAVWRECLRVLKPGGYILAFGGTRTWHRIAVAIEDAGFEIRDSFAWLYGSGFPKSMNVGKAIDKAAGAEREVVGTKIVPDQRGGKINSQATAENGVVSYEINVTAPATDDAIKWDGWGTALKPAFEPIIMGRKPLSEKTVAANVLKYGTGAINVDGTRIATQDSFGGGAKGTSGFAQGYDGDGWVAGSELGRWPANVLLDEYTAELVDEQSDASSRFFYISKANKKDRNEGDVTNTHPTVKPTNLMEYLIKLVTQPGGTVLDPFTGSGSTGKAAILNGYKFIGVELTEEYLPIIQGRLEHAEQKANINEGLF